MCGPAAGGGNGADSDCGELSLVVSWDGVTTGTVVGYRVQWKSGGQDYNTSDRQHNAAGAHITTYTIPNLEAGTEYTVRVRAVFSGTDASLPVEAKGTPEVPPAPAQVTGGNGDCGDLESGCIVDPGN